MFRQLIIGSCCVSAVSLFFIPALWNIFDRNIDTAPFSIPPPIRAEQSQIATAEDSLDMAWLRPCSTSGVSTFESGFDEGVKFAPRSGGQVLDLYVTESSSRVCDATEDFSDESLLKRANIQYQGGDDSERWAELVQDPLHPSNTALSFALQRANVRGEAGAYKGRVQMILHGDKGARSLKVSVRMYLSPAMALLSDFPGRLEKLAISEWWNNAGWNEEKYPFRISVNLVKEEEGKAPLHFFVKAQTLNVHTRLWNEPVWSVLNREVEVPLGGWVTLYYEIVEGDKDSGLFRMDIEIDGGLKKVVDVNNFTHHPKDPKPDGIVDFHPIKLYTPRQVIDYAREEGGYLQILWDDISIESYAR